MASKKKGQRVFKAFETDDGALAFELLIEENGDAELNVFDSEDNTCVLLASEKSEVSEVKEILTKVEDVFDRWKCGEEIESDEEDASEPVDEKESNDNAEETDEGTEELVD